MVKGKITYYTDALCGWCYGFSPVIKRLEKNFQAVLDFEVISGGLFLNQRVGDINMVAPYIKNGAYKAVESKTGVTFGSGFLNRIFDEQDSFIVNSLYPAIALCLVKEKFPKQALTFTHLLHKAVYFDGIEITDLSAYARYAAEIGFNETEFKTKVKEDIYRKKAIQEFQHTSIQQINGYPALVLTIQQENIRLANGYTSYEELTKRLTQCGIALS